MFLKPRYFLISGAVGVVLSAILYSYCRVPSLPTDQVAQMRAARRLSPQEQILQYYRDYPDRYIRVSRESWKYEENSRKAFHTFTLRNTATVPYHDIEVSFTYQGTGGKTLMTHTVKIAGALAPLETREIKGIEVKKVPTASRSVLVVVARALIGQ